MKPATAQKRFGPSYGQLSPRGQEQFRELHESTNRLKKYIGSTSYKVSDSLESLLSQNRLEQSVDSEGETLLDNLHQLATSSELSKSRKNEVFGWTCTHLAHPQETYAQVPNRGTCVPTVLTFEMLKEQPAEFVRLVDGLTSKERQVELANHDILERAVGSYKPKGLKGTPLEMILQASLMDYANPEQEYELSIDKFDKTEDTGLYPEQVERLAEAISNKELKRSKPSLSELDTLLKKVDDTLPTVVKWSDDPEGAHQEHMILVTGLDPDYVHYHNPWGHASDDETHLKIGRKVGDNGSEKLPRRHFERLLSYVLVPENLPIAPEVSKPQGNFFSDLLSRLLG